VAAVDTSPCVYGANAATAPPGNVKEQIVVEREFDNKRLCSEAVAEFAYRPTACSHAYRMVVVRKNISCPKERSACSMTYATSSTSRT
jgi:hypothetical protein